MGNNPKNRIVVYEHESLQVGVHDQFTESHLKALQDFYGERGTDYFSLIYQGVKFNQHVGVLKVDNLIVEVLPKADKLSEGDSRRWQRLLIDMLRAVGTIKVTTTGAANLSIRPNSILDLYFELFVAEVEQLVHKGLIKQYRRDESNRLSLKGKLSFPKHLQQNLVHQERFFVSHSIYDYNHVFNQILYQALLLLPRVNTSALLTSRIASLLITFPEVSAIKATKTVFDRLTFDRKSEPYREAIRIARMLLLNYHPDLNNGQHQVLALMFDMNVLWERFILSCLRKYATGVTVEGKIRKSFWQPERGYKTFIEPDIIIHRGGNTFVLDTKWKILKDNRPSDDDLKQMYVYTRYYQSSYTALVYPGIGGTISGRFIPEPDQLSGYPCSIIRLNLPDGDFINIGEWQKAISRNLVESISFTIL